MRLEDRFLRAVRSARQLGAKGHVFALLAFLLLWAGTAAWHAYKPLPAGVHVRGPAVAVDAAK